MFLLDFLMAGAMAGMIALLPFLFLLCMEIRRNYQKKNLDLPMPHIIGISLFCFLITVIFSITGIPSVFNLTWDPNINLIPFTYLSLNNYLQNIGNILLFIPLGFLLPTLWKPFESYRWTVLAGFLLSLFIEIFQLFNFRSTDVDDLMMNTMGAFIGWMLFQLMRKYTPKIASMFRNCEMTGGNRELFFCCFTGWLAMFFLEPFVAVILWKITG